MNYSYWNIVFFSLLLFRGKSGIREQYLANWQINFSDVFIVFFPMMCLESRHLEAVNICIFYSHLGGIHKLRWQARVREGSPKFQRYYISLFSKLVNEGGVKNTQNSVNVVYVCPLTALTRYVLYTSVRCKKLLNKQHFTV